MTSSRYILAWELSNPLDASFCVRTVQQTIAAQGVLKIQQRSRLPVYQRRVYPTSVRAWRAASMVGKGRCVDNVFVERLWRSLKLDEVDLKRYESMVVAHKQIGAYLAFYNDFRPHFANGHATPNKVYHAHHQTKQAA